MKILITGGASGLGRSITETLCANPDHDIIITYANSVDAAEALESKYSNCTKLQCNFRDPASVETAKEYIAEANIDCIVNNAFTGIFKTHFYKISKEAFSTSFEENILPVIGLTQAAINVFRKKKYGKIINILSSAMFGNPPIGWSMYIAEKNYLYALHKCWAAELKTKNITSNCISPTFMMTNLNKDTDERMLEQMLNAHPLKEFLKPEEVAKSVEYLVGASQHVNGTNIIINAAENVI